MSDGTVLTMEDLKAQTDRRTPMAAGLLEVALHLEELATLFVLASDTRGASFLLVDARRLRNMAAGLVDDRRNR